MYLKYVRLNALKYYFAPKETQLDSFLKFLQLLFCKLCFPDCLEGQL